jgi:uncharacterized protein (TIGR02271 family)
MFTGGVPLHSLHKVEDDMTQRKHSTVVGVFENREQAQKAVNELRRAGFREDEIGVITHDREGTTAETAAEDRGTHAAAGAAAGAATGAGVGALWALGIVAGVLPAVGPVIAGGILASVLASAAGTAVAGGIVGALIGLGIPEEEAHYYEGEFKSGRTIVTVKTDTRYDEARSILQRYGAYDRSTAKTAGARATTATAATGTGQTMRVHEEELHAHKQPVQTGEVRARKEVHTEHRTLEVPVEREEVVMERHPASGHPVAGTNLREGEEIRVPVKEEQVHIEKQPVVKEEVTIGKRNVKDTETVGGTVRKEEVKVEREGDAKLHDADTGTSCPPGTNRGKRN